MAVLINNASSRLASAHMAGSGTLVLPEGEGERFGDPTPDAPVRVTVAARSTLVNGQIGPTSQQTIFLATGRTGNTLVVPTAIEGTADQNFFRNDPVAALITAGSLTEVQGDVANAVKTTEEYDDPPWLVGLASEKVKGLDELLEGIADDLALKAPLDSPAFDGDVSIGGTLTIGLTGVLQLTDTGGGNVKVTGSNIFAFDTDELWVRDHTGTINIARFISTTEQIVFFFPLVLPAYDDALLPNGAIAWSTDTPNTLKCKTPAGTLKTITLT